MHSSSSGTDVLKSWSPNINEIPQSPETSSSSICGFECFWVSARIRRRRRQFHPQCVEHNKKTYEIRHSWTEGIEANPGTYQLVFFVPKIAIAVRNYQMFEVTCLKFKLWVSFGFGSNPRVSGGGSTKKMPHLEQMCSMSPIEH